MLEYQELKQKSSKDLTKELAKLREELRTLRFKAASGQLKKVAEIRKVRKMVARILFLLSTKTE